MLKKIILMLLLILISIFISGCIESGLQLKMNNVIKNDTRNSGIDVSVYTKGSTLVYDLKLVSKDKSMLDVFRVFLQFSEKVKDEKFELIELSYKGDTKFKIDGDYFKKLGDEYSWQNPVYTIRTFPENLLNPDGNDAYSKWTGGFLGVLKNQLDDFSDFHKKWYLNDLVKNGEINDKDIEDMESDINSYGSNK